ncbi:hypothetical protein SAMN05877962_110131 [Alloalcanivorax xenomutans]|uniref:hypothetical protein n=1 Tax=Alloalcanivorax xenomutans TaxID=1094342 RepID=UPI000BD3666B|nr:hypothetical protein [Alloalcanivorax xenomutans]SOC10619.1 hypothetical protein SAMN05877962_110131 [Alloalcanivorax xenomutans]
MSDSYREQHKLRLAYMPWLYPRLKPRHRAWAEPWQKKVQEELERLETVRFGEHCFVAPQARLFAEPGRDIRVGDHSHIAADSEPVYDLFATALLLEKPPEGVGGCRLWWFQSQRPQRPLAAFPAQPEGPGPFFRQGVITLVYVDGLHCTIEITL